jgi:hypothetical protein
MSSTLLQGPYSAFRRDEIVAIFGICSSNTFKVMPLQIKFKMVAVSHVGLGLVPYCKVITMPLDAPIL